MAEVIYICNADQSNKFWSYELSGNSVTTKWGRIGGTSDDNTKKFGSPMAAQKFIDTKVREKEKKGYKLASKEKLKEEVSTANALGVQNKIKEIKWVSKKGNELNQLNSYDPKQYVYVEVLNSWSKDITRLLLSRDQTWMVDGGVSMSGGTITCNKIYELTYEHTFASAVRDLLKKMATTVATALKSVKFGALGVRSIFDDESETPTPVVQEALNTIDSAGFEPGVIRKFAALGFRSLDL